MMHGITGVAFGAFFFHWSHGLREYATATSCGESLRRSQSVGHQSWAHRILPLVKRNDSRAVRKYRSRLENAPCIEVAWPKGAAKN